MQISAKFGLLITMLFFIFPLHAQEITENNVLLIVDCSHHMLKHWGGKKKIDHLKSSLDSALKNTAEKPAWGFNMGLAVYGDKSDPKINDCHDARVVIGMEWFDAITLTSAVEGLKPKGMPAVSYAIENTIEVFNQTRNNSHKYIIVIAANEDECREVGLSTVVKDVVGRVNAVHFIGLNLSPSESDEFEKAAVTGKGVFINVTNPSNLTDELLKVINEHSRYPKTKQDDQKEASESDTAR